MARVTNVFVVLLVLLAGGILLQVFLSRRESRWPGLVLPGICVLFSLIAVLSVAAIGSPAETGAALLMTLILYNIPTLVLLAVYAACRSGRKKMGEIEKMNISDL